MTSVFSPIDGAQRRVDVKTFVDPPRAQGIGRAEGEGQRRPDRVHGHEKPGQSPAAPATTDSWGLRRACRKPEPRTAPADRSHRYPQTSSSRSIGRWHTPESWRKPCRQPRTGPGDRAQERTQARRSAGTANATAAHQNRSDYGGQKRMAVSAGTGLHWPSSKSGTCLTTAAANGSGSVSGSTYRPILATP